MRVHVAGSQSRLKRCSAERGGGIDLDRALVHLPMAGSRFAAIDRVPDFRVRSCAGDRRPEGRIVKTPVGVELGILHKPAKAAAVGPPWGRLVEKLELAAGTRSAGNVLTLAGIFRREFSGYS